MSFLLKEGFTNVIRSKFGISEYDLSDEDIINSRFIEQAELAIKKRVPNYKNVTDEHDLFLLESAMINYICYLLCPTLALRLNIEVKTLDTTWKKDKVDWEKLAQSFLSGFEDCLASLETVEILEWATKIIDKVSYPYSPI